MQQRLDKEGGLLSYTHRGRERKLTSIEEMNLYDCNTLLITPATKAPSLIKTLA